MAVATETKVGKVVQIIGPVVDIEFAGGHLPAIYNACAPDTTSMISLVIAAWRTLFM